jgi:hypothetical protein
VRLGGFRQFIESFCVTHLPSLVGGGRGFGKEEEGERKMI